MVVELRAAGGGLNAARRRVPAEKWQRSHPQPPSIHRPRAHTVRGVLAAAFGLAIGLALLCGAAGVAGVGAMSRSVDELVRRVQPMRVANAELRADVSEGSRAVRGYLLTRDDRFLEPYTRVRHEHPSALARLRELAGPEEAAQVSRQQEYVERWFAASEALVAAPPDRADRAGTAASLRAAEGLIDAFLDGNDRLEETLLAEQRELERMSGALRTGLFLGLAALVALGVVLLVVIGVRTTRRVTGPLATLRDTLCRLAAGELGARVALPPTAVAEVRAVAESTNALADESERLRTQDSDRARGRELVRTVGQRIRDHLDPEAVLACAVDALGAEAHPDRVHIRLLTDDGTLGPVAAQWSSGSLETLGPEDVAEGPAVDGALRRLYEQHRSLVISDVAARSHPAARSDPAAVLSETAPLPGSAGLPDPTAGVGRPRSADDGAALFAVPNLRSFVAVPVAAGNDVYGLLTVAQVRGPRRWTAAEVQLVEAVAYDVARAMQHARLYEQQRELVAQLRELDRSKSDFLSTVSHELRTPLTSISGYVELLRDEDAGPVTAEQDRMLEIVDRNTWRLKALIEDLLTLSRIEAGALKVNPQPLVVADLVEAAAATLRPTLSGSDLVFDVDPGPRDACVHGDQGQLERVLLNLLSNAVKFSPDGGRVGLRAETTGDAVTITVSDTGIGIPEREQQQLFNRFFRASNATSRAIQGTGLGLSIVRSIVERHGGTLAVRSAVGQGTTVQVRLPQLSRADPPTPAAGQPGRSGDPPTLEPAVPSSGTLS